MAQQFCFKWNKHRNVMNELKNFLLTEAMVDVTLACDGQFLKAHKIVLSAYSPLFRSLFLENPCKHPIVILKDIKYTELKLIIDFMYCGEIDVIKNQLPTLMKTAQILGVRGLEEMELQNRQFNDKAGKRSCESSDNELKNPSSVKFDFKRNNSMNIMSEFKNFLLSDEMVDVTLICDGHSLKVHRLVLAAYSPFFMSLFLENSCEHPVIILKDMKYTELKSVIDFMYCSEITDKNQLSAVIKAAQSLRVEGLMEIEAQNFKSSDESGNPVDVESRNLIGDKSGNQSGNESQSQSVCAIDVSNWTLIEKQSLSSNTNENENYVTEIKQEILSDDSDFIVPDAGMQIVSSQSQDSNPFFQSEQDQPVAQNIDRNFASEDISGGSASNIIIQQILSAKDIMLPKHKKKAVVGEQSNSVNYIPKIKAAEEGSQHHLTKETAKNKKVKAQLSKEEKSILFQRQFQKKIKDMSHEEFKEYGRVRRAEYRAKVRLQREKERQEREKKYDDNCYKALWVKLSEQEKSIQFRKLFPKKIKDMSREEFKEYCRIRRAEYRAKKSHQKKKELYEKKCKNICVLKNEQIPESNSSSVSLSDVLI